MVIPADDPQVDYEAELAVVIGRRAKAVSEAAALDYVAGYMRSTMSPPGDGSLPTSNGFEENLATRFVQRVRGSPLQMRCRIHTRSRFACGSMERRFRIQHLNLVFRVPALIEFISASITLEPGDIIATGTPDGVGVFRKPPVFLKPGDVMEVDIEGLGILRNRLV